MSNVHIIHIVNYHTIQIKLFNINISSYQHQKYIGKIINYHIKLMIFLFSLIQA